jgi:hypothetical protein
MQGLYRSEDAGSIHPGDLRQAIVGQWPTRPDTSQILGPRALSKMIFVSSSLFCVGCVMFDKPPPGIFTTSKVQPLFEGAVRLARLPKTACASINQRHPKTSLVGQTGIESTSVPALHYGAFFKWKKRG